MDQRLDPRDRPPLDPHRLIAALSAHDVRWVLIGSHVLTLYGAKVAANDLDAVPELSSKNLKRVARCLESLGAVAAYLDGWGGERGTLDACHAWRPSPATADNLDWLCVTPFGMLDIVVANAEPYDVLRRDATEWVADDVPYYVCDPRRVLKALEGRTRKKDRERSEEYAALRRRLGPLPASV